MQCKNQNFFIKFNSLIYIIIFEQKDLILQFKYPLMIAADQLVFPAPKFKSQKKVQKKLIYIPKNLKHRHLYHDCSSQDYFIKHLETARTSISPPRSISKSVKIYTSRLSNKLYKPNQNSNSYIPCVFYYGIVNPHQLIIYFHSNAQDLTSAYDFAKSINVYTGQSVLVIQYPGYSYYQSHKLDQGNDKTSQINKIDKANIIENDAVRVFEYIKNVGYNLKDITVMGRSIGSGPAVYLASLYPIRSLILLSPFLSISQVVKDLYGNFCSSLLKQRFNNKERIQNVNCPILIIHGKQDKMIPFRHSLELGQKLKGYSSVKIIGGMTHSRFRCYQDFIKNLNSFYKVISD